MLSQRKKSTPMVYFSIILVVYFSITIYSQGNQGQFVPQYNYVSYDASKVVSVLTDRETGAGPTLKI